MRASTRVFFDKPLNAFMGAGELGIAHLGFRRRHRIHGLRSGLLRVGMIALSSNGDAPIGSFGIMPQGASKSNWGSEWKKAALEWIDRSAAIGMAGEHLAYRQNYMDLDPTYTDKFGDPLLRFTLELDRSRVQAARVRGADPGEYRARDGREVRRRPARPARRYNVINYQSTHIQGGAIMGLAREQRGQPLSAALGCAESVRDRASAFRRTPRRIRR